MENELAEHRYKPAHLYRVEEQIHSNDTQENRFLKYAIGQITGKYEALKKCIEAIKTTSDVMKSKMNAVSETLKHLQRNPFFRTVGRFKGFTQESLVLQRATGYSQVYRTWNLLRRAYSLYDGLYRLQSKDIATLYEIWCFIEVSHIVRDQLGISDDDVEHRNRMEMNGVFTWGLGTGEHSRILFKKDGVELAELVYFLTIKAVRPKSWKELTKLPMTYALRSVFISTKKKLSDGFLKNRYGKDDELCAD